MPEEAIEALSQELRAYLRALTDEECKVLARMRTDKLRDIIRGVGLPRDVRSPDELRQTGPSTLGFLSDRIRKSRVARGGPLVHGEEIVSGWAARWVA